MSVESITNSVTPVAGAVQDDPNVLSSTDFMSLLVTELQNQDPLEPMSTTEMSNQLTQMTMNEQLTEMNATLEENLVMNQSINNTAMLGLVGHDVTVSGNEVHVTSTSVTESAPTDDDPDATEVRRTASASGSMINAAGPGVAEVIVLDDAGAEVARYHVDVDGGLNDISWDGLGPDGDPVADGQYSMEVTVTDADGVDVTCEVLMTGDVDGLRYEQGVAVVSVFGTDYYVSEIYQVS